MDGSDVIAEILDWAPAVIFVLIFLGSVISSSLRGKKTQPPQTPVRAGETSSSRTVVSNRAELLKALGVEAEFEVTEEEGEEFDEDEVEDSAFRLIWEVHTEEEQTVAEESQPSPLAVGEGESHATPMGEPYQSVLATATAPSIEHSREHIDAPMPEGTVTPPPPGATVKAGVKVEVPYAPGEAALPKLRLRRGRTALRSAMVLREVLSRPRAYDI